jgi:hypothetical protein
MQLRKIELDELSSLLFPASPDRCHYATYTKIDHSVSIRVGRGSQISLITDTRNGAMRNRPRLDLPLQKQVSLVGRLKQMIIDPDGFIF